MPPLILSLNLGYHVLFLCFWWLYITSLWCLLCSHSLDYHMSHGTHPFLSIIDHVANPTSLVVRCQPLWCRYLAKHVIALFIAHYWKWKYVLVYPLYIEHIHDVPKILDLIIIVLFVCSNNCASDIHKSLPIILVIFLLLLSRKELITIPYIHYA